MAIQYKASAAGDLRRLTPSAAMRILEQIEERLKDPKRGGSRLSGEFAGLSASEWATTASSTPAYPAAASCSVSLTGRMRIGSK
jgi:hypothetical protein